MTWKAITRFGFAAEHDWPYIVASVDNEPDNFVFSSADKLDGLRYVRLDVRGERGRANIAAGEVVLGRRVFLRRLGSLGTVP